MAASLNTRLAFAFLVALVSTVAFVTQTPTPTLETYKPVDIQLTRGNTAIENFAAAIQCPTVGDEFAPNHVTNPGPFKQLHGVLQAAYPGLWKTLTVEKVSSYSLLFTWTGSNPALAPVLLISHQDVVPAPPANWTHDPFSGLVEDGFLYGRGTLDTKGSMMAILEGMEELRSSGWTPTRTLLFAAGHDEELGGKDGAGQISALLASRYPSLEVVLDEGGFLMADGLGPSTAGVLRPLRFAVVGLAEKGTTTWDLEVRGQGGHSSLPPPAGNTISARLGNLLGKVDATEPPARLQSPTLDFLKAMAPHAKHAPLSWLLRNAGAPVLRTVLAKLMGKSAAMGFMVRTVRGVVTVQAGGHAHNVLPTHANVTVNFRPIQGDGYDEVVSYLHTVTAGIRGHVTMTERPGSRAPSLVTPASGKHFALVRRAALETLTQVGADRVPPPPPLDVLPYVMSGATDSRHYQTLAPGRVLRFEPFNVYHADLARLHSLNERISCEAFLDGIKFYIRFMQLAAGSGAEAA